MNSQDQRRETARHGRIQSSRASEDKDAQVIGARRLAVFLGPDGSLAPAEIAASAAGLCHPHFLIDHIDVEADARLGTVAAALADTTVVDFGDLEASLDAVRTAGAGAAITFVDPLCSLVARVNRHLLGGHWPEHWGRKDAQRRMLADAGASAVKSALVGSWAELRLFAQSAGWPVVLKPVNGVGSRDTWLLRDEGDLVGRAGGSGDPGEAAVPWPMLAEQFIAGDPPAAGHLADYVSVEVFRNYQPTTSNGYQQVGAFVVGRLRPAEPLRETGLVVPAPLSPQLQESVMATATRALDVLNVTAGTFHVEVKAARHGSEVIEVNGRLGGYIARAVRYATGADLGRAALSCLLGRAEDLELSWDSCVAFLLVQPPQAARHVSRAPARRLVQRLPGVLAVDGITGAGTAVDWRAGTGQAVARLWLSADNHDELRERVVGAAEFLDGEFEFVDAASTVVASRRWLDAIREEPAGH